MPTTIQAGLYSAVMHYLKAIEATGTDEAPQVIAQMRATPINDFFAKGASCASTAAWSTTCIWSKSRSRRKSKGEWDLCDCDRPGDQAFRPLDEGGCPLVKPN